MISKPSLRLRTLMLAFVLASSLIGALPGDAGRSAFAQSPPHVTTSVNDPHPEVGSPFMVEMVISGSEPFRSVSSPQLLPPAGVTANGPSQSTRTQMQIVNGATTTSSSVVLSWVLTASQPGVISIPAPTVVIDGNSITGRPVSIDVTPSSGAPHSAPGFPSPFMSLTPASPFDLNDIPDDSGPAASDDLALPSAPDDQIFLHATADHTEAYLGQQVTLSFYVYYRVDFEMTERKEASLSDFLRVSLLSDPGSTTAQYTHVGGKRFGARLIDRVAVFPLKSGKLSTGTISARFRGRNIGVNRLAVSNDLTIDVKEPPPEGRPPGYVMGDVGHFAVSANVQPKETQQGSAVSVTVKLEGLGNLPGTIHMPQQKGVEWLEPERKDALATKDGKIGGTRTFGYVATLKNSGKVDLGEIEVPYFNPDTKTYEVTKAKIGEVNVTPTDPKPADIARAKEADRDLLDRVPKGRSALGDYRPVHEEELPTWGLASLIASPPILVGLGFGLVVVGRGARQRRREKLGSARSLSRDALEEASVAEKDGDAKRVAQSVERAVHAAIEGATGVASRGVLRESLSKELTTRGVDQALADEVLATFSVCEDLRYRPESDTSEMKGLIDRGRDVVKRLEQVVQVKPTPVEDGP